MPSSAGWRNSARMRASHLANGSSCATCSKVGLPIGPSGSARRGLLRHDRPRHDPAGILRRLEPLRLPHLLLPPSRSWRLELRNASHPLLPRGILWRLELWKLPHVLLLPSRSLRLELRDVSHPLLPRGILLRLELRRLSHPLPRGSLWRWQTPPRGKPPRRAARTPHTGGSTAAPNGRRQRLLPPPGQGRRRPSSWRPGSGTTGPAAQQR